MALDSQARSAITMWVFVIPTFFFGLGAVVGFLVGSLVR